MTNVDRAWRLAGKPPWSADERDSIQEAIEEAREEGRLEGYAQAKREYATVSQKQPDTQGKS